jgi:hypothetical protein
VFPRLPASQSTVTFLGKQIGDVVQNYKILLYKGGEESEAASNCTLGTGPNIAFYGPNLLDDGQLIIYSSPNAVSMGSIPLTAVVQLSQPGTVELRCGRNYEPVMGWKYVQLTAILVDEVVTQ